MTTFKCTATVMPNGQLALHERIPELIPGMKVRLIIMLPERARLPATADKAAPTPLPASSPPRLQRD